MRSHWRSRLSRAGRYYRQQGLKAFLRKSLRRLRGGASTKSTVRPLLPGSPEFQAAYESWILQNEPGIDDLQRQGTRSEGLAVRPLISILTPVFNPQPAFLQETLESVLAQTYPFWELVLVDGGSDREGVQEILDAYAARDPRIRLNRLPANLGISENTNHALSLARGEFIAFLDHDDRLAPFALFETAARLNREPELDLIYSDHDLLSNPGGARCQPLFKPDWSPEILLSANTLTHFALVRAALAKELGGFRQEYDGAQDWDFFLRLSERTQKIGHIPRILYHWRDSASSTAGNIWVKPYAPAAQERAITTHLERLGLPDAKAFFDRTGYLRAAWKLPEGVKVSIVIPSMGASQLLEHCVASILKHTHSPGYEIIIVNNGGQRPEVFPYYAQVQRDERVRVVHFEGPFNYNTVNNYGASLASGDLLLFLNNDTQVLDADWLEELSRWALREEVGVVGARLLFPDGMIQHAGVVIGLTGFAGHLFAGLPENEWTIFGRAEWYRDYQAVSAACMILRRELFEALGGFSEAFSLCGSDVELCLRARRRGLRVVYTPYARLLHHEGATRQTDVPADDYRASYGPYQPFLSQGDPYFNPNLSPWSTIPALSRAGEPSPEEFAAHLIEEL
jgi:glycosyltransferase involved in cell wall biosynthesis